MTIIVAASNLPEIPNFISLLARHFISHPFVDFLDVWHNIIYSFFVTGALLLFFYFAARKHLRIPSGMQNFAELIVENFQHAMVTMMGPDGVKYVPFLGTLFLYILAMNLFGLIPLMKSPTSNLSITLGLALCVFFYVQYLNIKHMGLKGFLYHLMGSPKNLMGWLIVPLMLPIELLTQFSRPITLALRLSGNILGEKILVGFFALMGATWLVFFPLQTPILFFGLLTSLIQASVFTLLSSVYILLSIPHNQENNQH